MATGVQQGTAAEARSGDGWLESPGYDLGLFLLAPLVGMAHVGLVEAGQVTLALVGATLLGIPHYLSTFTFLCWSENRAHQRKRWLAYYVGPLAIAALLFGALAAGAMVAVQCVTYFWNAYHVSRQSAGFVSLYRHRAGVEGAHHRRLANTAILTANGACLFVGARHHPAVRGVLEALHPELPRALALLTAGLAVLALVRLGLSFRERGGRGRGPRLPELASLAAALALFHPYLWLADAERATLTLLLGHFLQYLGLVWLVHRRRFGAGPAGGGAPRWLLRLSASLPMLLVVLPLAGGLHLGARWLTRHTGTGVPYDALFLLLTYTHFYLDGLVWSFRDPHVRRTLGPVLSPGAEVGGGRA